MRFGRRRREAVPVADWFAVTCDETGAGLDVRPPGRPAWTATVPWATIERVCLQSEDHGVSDGIYLFTSMRPEAFAVPGEATGGDALLDELMARELLPARIVADGATAAPGTVLCWPQDEPAAGGAGQP